jgi:DNA-binding transcriptional regulator YiaG
MHVSMSNQLAATLEKEVARVTQLALKRALATLNAEVTALKRKVDSQERRLSSVAAASARRVAAAPKDDGPSLGPAEVRALRKRLGLSQANLARVVAVTPVAVYFWEAGRTRPRGRRKAALLELRGLGKRAVQQRLAAAREAEGGKDDAGGAKAGSRRKKPAGRRAPARRKKASRKKTSRRKASA